MTESLRWRQVRRGHWVAESPLQRYGFVVWWVRIGKWHAYMIPYDYDEGSPGSMWEIRTLPDRGVRHQTLREAKAACLAEARRITRILAARDAEREH